MDEASPDNECTPLPLSQFKPGQKLHIRFMICGDRYAYCPVEFVAIVKGRVKVKCLDGWTPDWYDSHQLEARYPGRLATVYAKNCYVFGRAPTSKDGWPVCHWFKNIKEPACTGYGN